MKPINMKVIVYLVYSNYVIIDIYELQKTRGNKSYKTSTIFDGNSVVKKISIWYDNDPRIMRQIIILGQLIRK